MSRLRIMIIDDEVGSIKALEWELKVFQTEVEVIGTAQDPHQGLEMLRTDPPDILFLDIEMPGMNGFELLEKAAPLHCDVIFTTAYDKFAVKAFEVSAIDYLLKPVDEEELGRALQKVREKSNIGSLQQRLELLMDTLKRKDPNIRTIVVPTMESLEFLDVDEITRFEADSNYTKIHRVDSKPLLVSKTLKTLELMVEGMGFFRIHNSHLVNVKFIKKLMRGDPGTIVMKDETTLPLSRGRKGDLLDSFY